MDRRRLIAEATTLGVIWRDQPIGQSERTEERMSVVIANMTGNRGKFEDDLCIKLGATITAGTELRVARGEALVNSAINLPDDCRVLVVVAHAGLRPDKSVHIDMGVQPPCSTADAAAKVGREISCPCQECTSAKAVREIESPMGLSDLIVACSPYVLVFCSCRAFAPDTMASMFRDPDCLGIVASPEEVSGLDVDRVARIVDDLDAAVAGGVSDGVELQRVVHTAVTSTAGNVDFYFCETPRITVE